MISVISSLFFFYVVAISLANNARSSTNNFNIVENQVGSKIRQRIVVEKANTTVFLK
jgi:hypothetical protein